MDPNPGPTVATALLVFCLCSAAVAAQVLVFDVTDSTQLTDPDRPNSLSWSSAGTHSTVVSNANPDTTYLLELTLVEYNSMTGDAAVVEAREGSGNPIGSVTVNHSERGVPEEIRHDLLSDGTANYYNIPAGGELTIVIDAGAPGSLQISRTPVIPDHISVRTHRDLGTHDCGKCHVASSAPAVHQERGATTFAATDWQNGTCQECHGQTMTDLHTDCDNACHYEGYPIGDTEPHGPDIPVSGGLKVEGEYHCGDTCHGSASATSAHISEFTTVRSASYCPECHAAFADNGTVTELHERPGFEISDYSQSSPDCVKCHGIDGDSVHAYLRQKNRCGSGSCHTKGPS